MGLRSWAKRKAKQAKRKAEEAKRAAARKARQAKEATERKARQAKEAAERKARETFRKAEQAKRDALQAFDDALDKTTDPMERLAIKAERALLEGMSEMDVKELIRDEVRELKNTIKREIIEELREEVAEPIEGFVTEKVPAVVTEKLPDLVTEKLPEAMETAAKKGYEALTSPVADAIVDTLQLAAPSSAGVGVSVLDLSWDDLTGRVDQVQEWLKNPPDLTNWPELREFIERVGCSSVTINVTVRAAFLVASTNAAEIRGTFTWETADFLDKGEVIVKALKRIL